jgi:ER-bound oxygenase mpaB/B'/Rubber oxygenase, catalytic domain
MQWAMDVIAQDGLEPRGIGYRSTLRVRLIHALVRRHVAAMPDWRSDEWGLPINQTDMAATLVGALIVPSVGVMGMGLVLPPAEYEALAHFTRYVGWLLGVEDHWLPQDFRDSVRILFHTLTALANPDASTRQLAAPMIEDPLSWHYRVLAGPRRRLARALHLSVTSGILGPRAMQTLGLPALVPPWYMLVRIPFNISRSVAALLPGGFERAAVRGQREQSAFLHTMIGGSATIGASAHAAQVA